MTKPREKTREELQAEIEDGKKKILLNMQKGFCPKQGKSLKNYAIFRFSCKPRGTISSASV